VKKGITDTLHPLILSQSLSVSLSHTLLHSPPQMKHRTWPRVSSSPFSSLNFSNATTPRCSAAHSARSTRLCARPPPFPPGPNFSALPYDVVVRIAASFDHPNLRAASLVCRAWCEALRPLREAMVLLRWGKRFKHGRRGVRPNADKALDSFLKAAARGSALAMVDAGLIYWERGEKPKAMELYLRAAELGNPSAQCNLGISYLQGFHFIIVTLIFVLEIPRSITVRQK